MPTQQNGNPEDGHLPAIVERIREEYGWVDGVGYPAGVDVAELYRDPGKSILTAPPKPAPRVPEVE